MKKFKAKLAALLMTLGCFTVCLGAGVAVAMLPEESQVTANADATVHEIGQLDLHANSSVGGASGLNSQLYLKRVGDEAANFPVMSWGYLFTAADENCFKVNGEPRTLHEMKSTGDGMWWRFDGLNAGDVVTIEGTFNATIEGEAVQYVIAKSSFRWSGSGWKAVTTYTFNALNGGGGCSATAVYAYCPDGKGDAFPGGDWDNKYAFEAGSGYGLKLNGEALATTDIKQPGDFYINLGVTASEGDVLAIDGAYYSEVTGKYFIFNNCGLRFNGTTWETCVIYTTHNLGKVKSIVDANASSGYFTFADGVELPISSWDYAFQLESGNGITVDGNSIDMTNNVKSVGGKLFATFTTPASVDSVLTIGGTFYNESQAVKYVIAESKFTWNGSAWVDYIDYTTYTFNALNGGGGCSATAVYAYCPDGKGDAFPGGDWDNKYAFEAGSGYGLKLNGEALATTDIKQPGDFYINLGVTASEGDVLAIDGAYYSEVTGKRFVFNNCGLRFNGTTWETCVIYTTHNLGKVKSIVDADASSGYFKFADGVSLPISSWDYAFQLESGNGITVDGNSIDMTNNVKSVGGKLFATFTTPASVDSTLVIGGTFYNESQAVKYVIEESKFTWNGSAWVDYIDYTTYTFNALNGGGGCSATAVYAYCPDGKGDAFPGGDWDNKYAFKEGSGEGLKLNGEALATTDIKQPGDFYINLGATASKGDILTIDGTYYCEATAKKFVFNDCALKFNGTTWETFVEYTTHNLGKVKSIVDASASSGYFTFADGVELPINSWDYAFKLESGNGITVDGNPIDMTNNVKSVGGKLFATFTTPASVNSTLVIGGTFYNESQAVRYVIEESKFTWNGSAWEPYVEYTTYEVGEVKATKDSTSKAVYFAPASGEKFEIVDGSWAEKLTFETGSGVGVTLNGTLVVGDIKIPNDIYVGLGSNAEVGATVVIGGTFYNKTLKVRYVIEESTFVWSGSEWQKLEGTHVISNLKPTAENNTASNTVYFKINGDQDLLLTNGATFTATTGKVTKEDGTAVTIRNIKSTADGFTFRILGVTAGEVLTLSGEFECASLGVTYAIEECQFTWTGSKWEAYTPSEPSIQYSVHELGNVVSIVDASAANGYFKFAESVNLPISSWDYAFQLESGNGITVDGNPIDMTNNVKSVGGKLFATFTTPASIGSTLVIGGTFYNESQEVKYVIEDSEFFWNGYFWEGVGQYTTYEINKVYATNEEGTGNSAIYFAPWDGSKFAVAGGWDRVWTFATGSGAGVQLNGEALSTGDIKIPGNLYIGLSKAAQAGDVLAVGGMFYNEELGVIYVIEESACVWNGKVWLEAPSADSVTITYTTDNGSFIEYAAQGAYTLASGRTYETFIGWRDTATGAVYAPKQTITVAASMTLEAVTIEFFLEDGAAIRLATTADESGIRFTTYINSADKNALSAYGIEVLSYGTLIMPLDYLGAGQEPNLADFEAGKKVVKIESTKNESEGNYIVYRGAMWTLNEGNYDRLFAGRGYMVISVNGEERIVYTPFNLEDNVRSIRNVAQKFMADTEEYNSKVKDTVYEAVVETYAAVDTIKLMNYEAYKANNVFNVIAWYHPELDPSNNYDNEANRAAAKKMKDAGIKAVYLDGANHLNLNIPGNVEATRQIIQFFWSQGLYTIAFGSNSSDQLAIDYTSDKYNYPDFSDCEGFLGFLAWDEPTSNSFGTLAAFAEKFEALYAGTDAMFMTNLLPSYASPFNKDTHWWQSSKDSLQVDTYTAYLEDYCKTVLSEIEGEKWLSLDSYPIKADASLMYNFLFDLVMLKQYAEQYGAHSHIVLQSSGWTEGSSTHTRMPTEAELRMQAYTAMALGIDSISWWSYANKRGDGQENPTDNNDYYTRFANVNNELNAISHVYSAFEWKGVISASGTYDSDAYTLFETGLSQFSNQYKLTTSKTKNLLSVSRSNSSIGYLMGVMEDMNGNEGYVISNYNNHKADRTQTLTLRFTTNVTEAVIYRGGVAETVSVSSKKLTISLTTGEGVIVLPSKLG